MLRILGKKLFLHSRDDDATCYTVVMASDMYYVWLGYKEFEGSKYIHYEWQDGGMSLISFTRVKPNAMPSSCLISTWTAR